YIIDINKASCHTYEFFGALHFYFAILYHRINDYMLAYRFNIIIAQIRIYFAYNSGDQYSIDDFRFYVPRHSFKHCIILKNASFKIVQIAFNNIFSPLGGWFFEPTYFDGAF